MDGILEILGSIFGWIMEQEFIAGIIEFIMSIFA